MAMPYSHMSCALISAAITNDLSDSWAISRPRMDKRFERASDWRRQPKKRGGCCHWQLRRARRAQLGK